MQFLAKVRQNDFGPNYCNHMHWKTHPSTIKSGRNCARTYILLSLPSTQLKWKLYTAKSGKSGRFPLLVFAN